MRKFIVFALLFVFLLTSVSAWTKTYDSETNSILIESDAGTDLIRITLEYNTYVCGYECEAVLKWDVLVDGLSAPMSPFKVKKFINNQWSDSSLSLDFEHNTTTGVWRDLTYSQFNTGLANSGTYWMKIKGYKQPDETYDWIPSLNSDELLLDEWAVWGATQVYDEIDDSHINQTLWSNTTSGSTGTYTTTENADYMRAYASNGGGSGNTADIDSILFPSSSSLQNVTMRISVSATMTNGANCGKALVNVFGNTLNSINACSSGSDSDDSVWKFIENGSQFDLYDDDVYVETFTPTNSIIQLDADSFGTGYNGDTRLYYVYYIYGESAMNITLNSPTDSTNVVSGESVLFNSTVEVAVNNLVNMTLYLNGIANETKSLSGTEDTETFTKTLDTSIQNWSVQVCDDGVNCKMSDVRDINVGFLVEDAIDYDTPVFEGSTQTFTSQVSFDSTTYPNIDAALWYNGTRYTASKVTSTSSANFTRSIDVPLVSTDTNITFYWNYTLIGASTDYVQGTSYNQTVTNFQLDDCSTYSFVVLNYTLYDEDTQVIFDGDDENATIEIDLDLYSSQSSSPVAEFQQSFSDVNNATVCIENALGSDTYIMDVEVKYGADGYQTEYHNIQDFTLSSSTMYQNISLRDLSSSTATRFTITYKDSSFIPVQGAVIDITRNYVSEGTFKTIEKPITDSNGKAVASLREDDTIYSIFVYKGGVLLASFNNVYAICQDSVIGQCDINLNALSSITIPDDFSQEGSLYYNINYNEGTRTISVEFSTTDGSEKTISLDAYVYDQYLNDSVCSSSLTSSSGTVNCVIPAEYTNVTILTYLKDGNNIVETFVVSLIEDPSDTFGTTGYILILLIMITLPLMFITSPIGMMFGVILGAVMSGLLLLSTGGSTLALGVSGMWLVVAALLVIWQLNNRNKGGA